MSKKEIAIPSSRVPLIDTHCHIFTTQFDDDLEQAIQRALVNNVTKIFMPNIDRASVETMNAVAEKFPSICYPMMAIHPCDVKKEFSEDLEFVDKELATGKYIAVGETGIDLYWDKNLIEQQKESFQAHLRFGKKYNLPVIIHIRESFDEVFEVVEKEASEDLYGIFHCFTGTLEEAHRAIELGFSLGVGGVSTFKKSHLPEVLSEIDIQHLVLETDSPYLAPTPYRGKRNEPSYIPFIAQRLAEIKNTSIDEIAKLTTDNALKIFNLMP